MAVTPSASAIARLKRLTAATVDPKLTDADMADALTMYALADGNGVVPDGTGWLETFDYYGAAIEALGWKKAAASAMVNFNADGTQASMSDITRHINGLIGEYTARRSVGTITVGSGL
jgi:hypothetical protein